MKTAFRFLASLALLAAPAAQGYRGWALNQFLAFEFGDNPAIYAEFVAAGSPCYAWAGGGAPDSPQPYCYYDPSNANPGYVPAPAEARSASPRRR